MTKFGIQPLASALILGYSLAAELTFQMPVWTCMAQPFQGVQYIGGFYRTLTGPTSLLTEHGWRAPLELGAGHNVFVGLQLEIALNVAAAARGRWESLDNVRLAAPQGGWGSEFAWLLDGTVAAPVEYLLPAGLQAL